MSSEPYGIISVRDSPAFKEEAIDYFQQAWTFVKPEVYRDSITHAIGASQPLPQWYLLQKAGKTIGCAGLITNDFISRMDLYPWICAIYIEKAHRGKALSGWLIDKAKADAGAAGFENIYLSTDHVGLYEKFGFAFIGKGYHPWGESSRIYVCPLTKELYKNAK
jgi:GNAT superfamily N-acetyltransferase